MEFDALRAAAREAEAAIAIPDKLQWPHNHRLAVNVTADFDAMLLRRLFGEPPMQLAKGEFGGRVGIWRLLDLWGSHDIKATVFTPGRICELYPQAIEAAAKAGHEIADHMWEHQVPGDPATERAHLTRTMQAIERVAGRAPVGTRSGHTSALLVEMGFIYNSSVQAADQVPYFTLTGNGRLADLPFHYAIDDAMFFSFSWMNTRPEAQRVVDPERVYDLWLDAFMAAYEDGGYMNICLHPFVSGHALRIDMLDRLFGEMKKLPGVWFPTCEDVARHVIESNPVSAAGA